MSARMHTFTYAQVEAALASVHEIPAARMKAFRGRLKHFLRLGIVPSSPGKGNKITYTINNVYMWAICLELEEFGLDPVRIEEFYRLGHAFQVAVATLAGESIMASPGLSEQKAGNYLIFYPNFLSQWDGKTLWTASVGFVDSLSEIDEATWGRPVGGGRPVSERFRSRVGAISLTWLREAVQNALAAQTRPLE
jgi:hypothetical protein